MTRSQSELVSNPDFEHSEPKAGNLVLLPWYRHAGALDKNVFDFVVNLHAVSKKAKSSVAKNPKQINTSYDVCAFRILLQGFERSVENLWDRRSRLVYGIVRLGPE